MSQSTIFQSCPDGATASWVLPELFIYLFIYLIYLFFLGGGGGGVNVSCIRLQNGDLSDIEPSTSRSGVRRSTTRYLRLPIFDEISVTQRLWRLVWGYTVYLFPKMWIPSSNGLSYLKLWKELQSNLYI